ncbi:MAG: SUMF1/EgtB/PvdO family nonheme iron enzyme [Acidobacteriota bacterium]|nr:SUMF1/EgtB/PvdO family nonheme iron enzyme [Acidobacteriota bacterium]
MGAPASSAGLRHILSTRLADARLRSDELFAIVRKESMYERPIPERHRIIFYLGHLEAFDWNLLAERAFGLRPFQRTFDQLFSFGIDPVGGGLPTDTPSDWPSREEIENYTKRIREKLDRAIDEALGKPGEGHPQLRPMLEVAIEHRLMHAETLAYMLHRLPAEKKIGGKPTIEPPKTRVKTDLVGIPGGMATLGLAAKDDGEFGWDNEMEAHHVDVPAFCIEKCNVTNGDFTRFIQAGGYNNRSLWDDESWAWKKAESVEHPVFWRRNGNLWMYRAMFGDVRLPLDWPVYLSHAEATAYANWLGRKLPTEAQFHRAAYGSPATKGTERRYPWGDEAPDARHGNFDFQSWDPSEVGSHPAGASAFGIEDLVGNGWEWTRTKFAPFPGFKALPFYPGYSANFFDGKHFVMKGGSPRTAACMLRPSFRNWFQPHYPYVYATFRCVED